MKIVKNPAIYETTITFLESGYVQLQYKLLDLLL